jgi:hypothetical protein
MGDKTPLSTHKLELLGVFVAWLQGGEIVVGAAQVILDDVS